MKPEQLAAFKAYQDHLNMTNNMVYSSFGKLKDNIDNTQKFRYLFSIIMGTELIKEKLIAHIIFDDYINEMRWYLEKSGEYNIKKIDKYEGKSFGQILKIFSKKFNLELNDKEFYNQLQELNNKRNDTTHHSILKYLGDLNKADEEIKPYILAQPLDTIQRKLTSIINQRIQIQMQLEEEMKKRNLFNIKN